MPIRKVKGGYSFGGGVYGTLKKAKASYLLLIKLVRKVSLPKKFNFQIKPGFYAYAGNANGPGGIQGRCKRHFKCYP